MLNGERVIYGALLIGRKGERASKEFSAFTFTVSLYLG